jgi:hypothetical protein
MVVRSADKVVGPDCIIKASAGGFAAGDGLLVVWLELVIAMTKIGEFGLVAVRLADAGEALPLWQGLGFCLSCLKVEFGFCEIRTGIGV